MIRSQVSLKVGDLLQDFGYVEFHDNSVPDLVLHEPYHEILRKRVTVEINKNSKKQSNPEIRTAGYIVGEKQIHSHDTRHTNEGYFSSIQNGQQDDFSNIQKEDNTPQGIIPSSMFWNDTLLEGQADCQAANLNRICFTPSLDHKPITHLHYAIQAQSSLITNVKLPKNEKRTPDSQIRGYVKYNEYYRHLKSSGIDDCQRLANPENYKHRKEAISTGNRRIARLQAALHRLRF